MNIITHEHQDNQLAEVVSDGLLITTAEDGLQLMADLYYQGFDRIAVYEKNISPAFFDLKTGLAGEILQKFSNYRVRLAIIGDFSNYTSKSLRDFMYESNQQKHIHFAGSLEEAKEAMLKK